MVVGLFCYAVVISLSVFRFTSFLDMIFMMGDERLEERWLRIFLSPAPSLSSALVLCLLHWGLHWVSVPFRSLLDGVYMQQSV